MTIEQIDYRRFDDHYQPIRLRTQLRLEQLLRDRQKIVMEMDTTQEQCQQHEHASQTLVLQLQAHRILTQLTRQHCLEQLMWQEGQVKRLNQYHQALQNRSHALQGQIQQQQMQLDTLDQLSLEARHAFANQSLQQLSKMLDDHVCRTHDSTLSRID